MEFMKSFRRVHPGLKGASVGVGLFVLCIALLKTLPWRPGSFVIFIFGPVLEVSKITGGGTFADWMIGIVYFGFSGFFIAWASTRPGWWKFLSLVVVSGLLFGLHWYAYLQFNIFDHM